MTQVERSEAHQYGRTIFEWVEKLSTSARIKKIDLRLPRLSGDPLTAARITRSSLGYRQIPPFRT